MTPGEASIFFPFEEGDDLMDLYEERLFEYKQFFITKFPIAKVFIAKQKKMFQMNRAFFTLGGKIITEKEEKTRFNFPPSEAILDTFNIYQKFRNELKNKINKSESAEKISELLAIYLQLQNQYYNFWPEIEPTNDENILFSKEPDPMDLLKSIQEFKNAGGILFSDILLKRNISPELLINEAKRLSLCRKIEKNG